MYFIHLTLCIDNDSMKQFECNLHIVISFIWYILSFL